MFDSSLNCHLARETIRLCSSKTYMSWNLEELSFLTQVQTKGVWESLWPFSGGVWSSVDHFFRARVDWFWFWSATCHPLQPTPLTSNHPPPSTHPPHSGLARGGLGHFGVNFFIAFFGVFCILYIHINMEKSIKNKINIVKVLKITHFWGTNAHFTL